MAILTADQLAELRRACALEASTVRWDKAQVNAATQAIEDWFEANRASLSTAINTATQALAPPITFTVGEKLFLVKRWLLSKYSRGG